MSNRPAGVVCPIITPLTADQNLDETGLRTLVDRILPDLDGLLVLGTTGEFALLPEKIALQAVHVAVEQVAGRVPVYAGIGDTGTQRVLAKLRPMSEAGTDYFLVTAPYYFNVSDAVALKRHFFAVADHAERPVLIYNMTNTHNNLSPALMSELAGHPNIVGLKDSWGDFFQFQEFLTLRSEKFSVFMGPEQLFAASLWLGADGLVSALGNIAPFAFRLLYDQVRQGDKEGAIATQRAITRLADIFKFGTVPGAIKVLLQDWGIVTERLADPLPPCTDDQKAQIRAIVKQNPLFQGG